MAGLFSAALTLGVADCPSPCGNGTLDTNETCDDGRHCTNGTACTADSECAGIGDGACAPRSCDGCNGFCLLETGCGDAVTCGAETCDDGNTDNCTGSCNATCTGPGNTCGDGALACSESCDDGNTVSGDGCAANCVIEPVLSSVSSIIFNPVAPGKTAGPEGGTRWFTNDRQTRLTQAIVAVSRVAVTDTLVLRVSINGQTRTGALVFNTGSTWNLAPGVTIGDFNLAGGDNAVTFTVRRTSAPAATSNEFPSGAQSPRVIESAWAEIVIDPAVVINGFLIRDDFNITGETNRNDLIFQAMKTGGATRSLAWVPQPSGNLFFFSQRVDGGGHDTHVGFRRPGRPAFEVLDTSFTLDPSIFLAPVALWIVRGLADTNAPAQNCNGNVGSDGGVAELTEFFDDPVYSEPNPAVNVRSSADVIWSQVGVQFDVEEANIVNIVDDLAANAFDGHGNCSISGIFCNPSNGNADCLPAGGVCVQSPRSLVACCRYGYDPRAGREGICCNASGRYIHSDGTTLVPCTDVRTRDDEGCSVVIGHDIGRAIVDSAGVPTGRSPDRLNLYFLNNLRTGSGMANGHRLAFGHRAAAFYDDGIPCRASLGDASLIVAHELGHLMGLDHVCARNNDTNDPVFGSNPGCCTLTTGFCSNSATTPGYECDPAHPSPECSGGVCTASSTVGEFMCSDGTNHCIPPASSNLNGDACLNSGICLLKKSGNGCPDEGRADGVTVNTDYFTCDANFPSGIMNQSTCSMGVGIEDATYYHTSIVLQSLIRSGIYESGNHVANRNN